MTLVELVAQIDRRDPKRTEATLQADIRQLLLTAPLWLKADRANFSTCAGRLLPRPASENPENRPADATA
jgi:hypothetical protein